jgi:hypothetical protein
MAGCVDVGYVRLDHAHEFVLVGAVSSRPQPLHLVLIITALSSCGRSGIQGHGFPMSRTPASTGRVSSPTRRLRNNFMLDMLLM